MMYKATIGLTAKLTTAFVTILIAGIILIIGYNASKPGNSVLQWLFAVSVISCIAFIYLWTYLVSSSCYFVLDDRIIIKRPYKNVIIPLSEIKDVFRIKRGTSGAMEKNGGNFGLFGFSGEFKTAFGPTILYGTRLDNLVMLQTFDNENIIITPDDTTIVKEIRKLLSKNNFRDRNP